MSTEEVDLKTEIDRILESPSKKKLIVAGPGTGKTFLFGLILKGSDPDPADNLVLTFLNNLRDDLENDLSEYALVYTLHSYCLRLLYNESSLRSRLSDDFVCFPRLTSLIKRDWEYIYKNESPQFVREMRNLLPDNNLIFYIDRSTYYDAVDFDDIVYRAYLGTMGNPDPLGFFEKVLIDEYQDFNMLENSIINRLAANNSILIVGDDDQALYSKLRDSSWDYIRSMYSSGQYEIFELPYCMRCPKVIVDAVGDIIIKARQIKKLRGRIDKPFKHFPPVKGADSTKYPNICLVKTSVQRNNANYMGRYIEHAIKDIPQDEIEESVQKGFPAILVIAIKPYRPQIISYLKEAGIELDTRQDSNYVIDQSSYLSILKEDIRSNLGWRIALEIDQPPFLEDLILKSQNNDQALYDLLPEDYRDVKQSEVDSYKITEEDDKLEQSTKKTIVRVTSFEGAKGLSAQHVFIAGLHDGELPKDPEAIQDLEICKFVVSLTRARKKCTIIHTGRFGQQSKSPSTFISWIAPDHFENLYIDREYWDNIE